jgi:hypothetical protein
MSSPFPRGERGRTIAPEPTGPVKARAAVRGCVGGRSVHLATLLKHVPLDVLLAAADAAEAECAAGAAREREHVAACQLRRLIRQPDRSA